MTFIDHALKTCPTPPVTTGPCEHRFAILPPVEPMPPCPDCGMTWDEHVSDLWTNGGPYLQYHVEYTLPFKSKPHVVFKDLE